MRIGPHTLEEAMLSLFQSRRAGELGDWRAHAIGVLALHITSTQEPLPLCFNQWADVCRAAISTCSRMRCAQVGSSTNTKTGYKPEAASVTGLSASSVPEFQSSRCERNRINKVD